MNTFEKIAGISACIIAILGAAFALLAMGSVAMSDAPASAPGLFRFTLPAPTVALILSVTAFASGRLRRAESTVMPLALTGFIISAITLVLSFIGWKN